MNAATTTLTAGAPATGTVTLYWTDVGGTSHSAGYSLSGTTTPFRLLRNYDGRQTELGRRVDSMGFRLTGKTLFFDLVVQRPGP